MNYTRGILILVSISASIYIGCKFGYLLSENDQALGAITTIFSILAGFLIGIITLIAEPTLAKLDNWKDVKPSQNKIRKKLIRQQMVFYVYLISLTLAIFLQTFSKEEFLHIHLIEKALMSLTTFALLLSFTIPSALLKLQSERFDLLFDQLAPDTLKSKK